MGAAPDRILALENPAFVPAALSHYRVEGEATVYRAAVPR